MVALSPVRTRVEAVDPDKDVTTVLSWFEVPSVKAGVLSRVAVLSQRFIEPQPSWPLESIDFRMTVAIRTTEAIVGPSSLMPVSADTRKALGGDGARWLLFQLSPLSFPSIELGIDLRKVTGLVVIHEATWLDVSLTLNVSLPLETLSPPCGQDASCKTS